MSSPVELAVIGAGSRGFVYSAYALQKPEKVKITAVAEPDDSRREKMKDMFKIPPDRVFRSWEEFVQKPKMSDGVLICTQDKMHTAPTIACADRGYDILLEKPIATTLSETTAILDAVRRNKIIFSIGFVLRYSGYYKKYKELLDSGVIGKILTFRHLEQVGYWHQAHSFVRGNWRNSEESCPMILAKCCHDLDILNFLIRKKCCCISSFGSHNFFRYENMPEGAACRCVDCRFSKDHSCIYSAENFYFGKLHRNELDWPLDVITSDMTEAGVAEALRKGSYGRCVFSCDNDVVDSQTVNFSYESGIVGTMTMTAFGEKSQRRLEFYGSHGQIIGNGNDIEVTEFGSGRPPVVYQANSLLQDFRGGHGGGDTGLIATFVDALAKQEQSVIGATPDDIEASQKMAFAAEKSRLEMITVQL